MEKKISIRRLHVFPTSIMKYLKSEGVDNGIKKFLSHIAQKVGVTLLDMLLQKIIVPTLIIIEGA